MSQKPDPRQPVSSMFSQLPGSGSPGEDVWQTLTSAVATRFNREYRREAFDLPAEVEAMPIFREWAAGGLSAKIASPFWELAKPQKNPALSGHWMWSQLFGISLAGVAGIVSRP